MRTLNKHPWSLYAVSLVLWCVFIVFLYCSDVFDATFIKWNMDLLAAKITFGILSGVLLILMWVGLYFENRYYQKRILDFSSIPSPIEVAFIVMQSRCRTANESCGTECSVEKRNVLMPFAASTQAVSRANSGEKRRESYATQTPRSFAPEQESRKLLSPCVALRTT